MFIILKNYYNQLMTTIVNLNPIENNKNCLLLGNNLSVYYL